MTKVEVEGYGDLNIIGKVPSGIHCQTIRGE